MKGRYPLFSLSHKFVLFLLLQTIIFAAGWIVFGSWVRRIVVWWCNNGWNIVEVAMMSKYTVYIDI